MHVPKTLDELLVALESLDGEVLTTRQGETFPVGVWAMQASNVIRQQQVVMHDQHQYIHTKCVRPISMGEPLK